MPIFYRSLNARQFVLSDSKTLSKKGFILSTVESLGETLKATVLTTRKNITDVVRFFFINLPVHAA